MARQRDWISSYLSAIGAPNTQQNRRFLAAWQRWEGGHTNNSARFNYLNTTQKMPGSSSMNSVGVQSYRSAQQGAAAFAKTLRNGRYGDLVGGLKSGNPYKANVTAGLSTWLSGSATSPQGQKYAAKVLGLDVAPPPASGGGRPGPGKNKGPGARTQGVSSSPIEVPPDLNAPRMFNLDMISRGGHYDPMDSLNALTESLMSQGHLHSAYEKVLAPGIAPTVKKSKSPKTGLEVEVDGSVNPRVRQVVQLAEKYLGTPYSWGGGGPGGPSEGFGRGAGTVGFDCSSLLQFVWGKNGVKIPRVTYDQWKTGKAVSKKNLRPGDAVFFHPGSRGPEHVGMYIGNGRFIEAPRTGLRVRISKLAGRDDYMGARRYGTQPNRGKKR